MKSEVTQRMTLAEIERAAIEAVMTSTGGNKREAAEILGIDRKTLATKLARYRAEDEKSSGVPR